MKDLENGAVGIIHADHRLVQGITSRHKRRTESAIRRPCINPGTKPLNPQKFSCPGAWQVLAGPGPMAGLSQPNRRFHAVAGLALPLFLA